MFDLKLYTIFVEQEAKNLLKIVEAENREAEAKHKLARKMLKIRRKYGIDCQGNRPFESRNTKATINNINRLRQMELRVGSVLVLIEDKEQVKALNDVISRHSEIIIGRQGLRLADKGKSIISLVLEGTTDQMGALTGQLGKIQGIHVKSLTLKTGL